MDTKKLIIQEILQVGGIAGLIALLIAITICVSVLIYPNKAVPEVLSSSLTIILGFYFGTKVPTIPVQSDNEVQSHPEKMG